MISEGRSSTRSMVTAAVLCRLIIVLFVYPIVNIHIKPNIRSISAINLINYSIILAPASGINIQTSDVHGNGFT